MSLEELKKELMADLGKITCWQWLCQDRNATTEEEKMSIAKEVRDMPRMGNIATALQFRQTMAAGRPTSN
jgi:hypothetical protein